MCYDNCKDCHSACEHAGKDREFVCPKGVSCKVEKPLTNAQVLCESLKDFDKQESFIQENIADYIACPSVADCKYDGIDDSCCAPCKVKWLLSKWEG